ncbi:MAG: SH3 domain-containing protein, partial [bacterium]|nr:SH3 domain-containing protein [bacterium]
KAIAINNTYARALPDASPDFFHFSLPGQGFPFDNLQESVIWSGTPLYIISVSKNKAWSLVLTPDAYFSWVKSNDIAITSKRFINQWQDAAQKNMVAITQTESSVFDNNHQFQFSSYIGAVFPLVSTNKHISSILIPKKNAQQQAIIALGNILSEQVSVMPLSASKQNLVKLIKQLQNRPYGWGGAFFFNDCSQELKSIFTPLGIWLPRNSFQQAHFTNTIDLSEKSLDERLQILENQGHPLMTLIYIGGHVMLYLGKKPLNTGESAVMTYQNIWGLSPNAKNKRYIIGQSLFFPLLKIYPENPEINSLANTNYFTLIHLDELASESPNPEHFAKQLVHKFSGDNQ